MLADTDPVVVAAGCVLEIYSESILRDGPDLQKKRRCQEFETAGLIFVEETAGLPFNKAFSVVPFPG
jgi:hypothetical protein